MDDRSGDLRAHGSVPKQKEIAELSYRYRTLSLGYANLGAMLMRMGIPYDSEMGRAICGSITAVLTGDSYATSAEMAEQLEYIRVTLAQQRGYAPRHPQPPSMPAYHAADNDYEGLGIKPVGIDRKRRHRTCSGCQGIVGQALELAKSTDTAMPRQRLSRQQARLVSSWTATQPVSSRTSRLSNSKARWWRLRRCQPVG